MQWVYNKEKNLLPQGSKVVNTKATTYFFYIPTTLINTHSRIQYRGCKNLATSIGSSMKSFTSFILTVSNSLRGSKLFEYLKLPVPLGRGWETVNNRMHSCRSPGKLVRQVREPSEGFGFKHS